MYLVVWMEFRVDGFQGKILYGKELEHNKSWIVSYFYYRLAEKSRFQV